MMAYRGAVLQALVDCAPPLWREHFRPDCCIAATRIGIEALRYFGIAAVPQPCQVRALNNQMAAHIERDEIDDVRTCEYWTPIDGSWGVGIGYHDPARDPAPERPGWNGHLVLCCNRLEAPVLVDLSIAQAARPQHAMLFEPFIGTLPPGWPTAPADHVVFRFDEGVLSYVATADRGYESAPDWTVREFRPIAGELIRRMKGALRNGKERPD